LWIGDSLSCPASQQFRFSGFDRRIPLELRGDAFRGVVQLDDVEQLA
jgi:hypothetical protein